MTQSSWMTPHLHRSHPPLSEIQFSPYRKPILGGLLLHILTLGIITLGLSVYSNQSKAAPSKHASSLNASSLKVLKALGDFQFDQLGHPAMRWDVIPPVYASADRPHRLLVVLVEFADLGFTRFKDSQNQAQDLVNFYQEALFDPSYTRPNTLSHYYAQQSLGKYHLQGTVLPPLTLNHPRSYYGRPKRPEGGSWRNDSRVEDLVEEVLAKVGQVHPQLNWQDFDQWDPLDYNQNKRHDEADGYLDHLVLIYAGGGQSSCQSLHKLSRILTRQATADVFKTLNKQALECADRIWPHRFMIQRREEQGPQMNSQQNNPQGGVQIRPNLWAKDYNMQSEYTGAATFIHEFGHSIGLPDIYARQTSNSTGAWEVMSGTTDPSPQNLSAWSRLMLGWLKPTVILPPQAGGSQKSRHPLKTLDDPLPVNQNSSSKLKKKNQSQHNQSAEDERERALLIALPPQEKNIHLTALNPKKQGEQALYSGQGNELNRSFTLKTSLKAIQDPYIEFSFDGWWEIEAGWDFAYIEIKESQGQWVRLVDSKVMPAKHGHDGPKSKPGLTGLSGDFDGDGKNEHHPQCDPKKEIKQGEEKKEKSPCEKATWSQIHLDLSPWKGKEITLRIRYFTDMAAVEKGILVDNLRLLTGENAQKLQPIWTHSFESVSPSSDSTPSMHPVEFKQGDFLPSSGQHTFQVPHYYLVEHRDPYAGSTDPKSSLFRYDSSLSKSRPIFYYDLQHQEMRAFKVRTRPGALVWYFNGNYAWSENEPTSNGPGKGFLLAVDASPNELKIPSWEDAYQGQTKEWNTHYNFKPREESKKENFQARLKSAALKTMCFLRSSDYLPKDLPKDWFLSCLGPQLDQLSIEGKTPRFVYEVINQYLPEERSHYMKVSELYDYRKRTHPKTKQSQITWSLRNRSLRSLHMKDAPFSPHPFERALEFYRVHSTHLELIDSSSLPAFPHFNDTHAKRWMNPKLRFGGVAVPQSGLSLTFHPSYSPDYAVEVEVEWNKKNDDK